MQLTRQTDYAIRVMMFLGIQQDENLVTISDIAQHFDISRNHLMKIVHKLGQMEYIQTVRGKYGGLRLERDTSSVNLGKLVKDFETTLEVVDCQKLTCPIAGACELKPVLRKAQEAFLGVLNDYTLQDLLTNPADLRSLLGLDTSEELPLQVMAVS
ncbi:transcriptional regulator, BadM/Rrf2 family [Marinospirillum celere]|uniref:Transcriptional regulator, BadM/Rrf2 family n=1 Tax=Marinospirillum celere TaxID=1122252 RepID=A0A1I1H5Y5_9GAMM|nr:Rrf2 family transcriptional regulator [Marinospirillum celere]SFC19417.1 transcriptional regulator, BadM/Rrf2 family [Marinospirillum celere]